MRYFILFFCLLFGQNATIQANYSAPQIANYQIISADITNPIEPIKPKKSKKNKNIGQGFLENWLFIFEFFVVAFFLSGLVFYPIAIVAGSLGWAAVLLILEIVGVAVSILVLLLTSQKNIKAGVGVTLTLFLFLKSIELFILGLAIGNLAMWLVGLVLFLLIILFVIFAAQRR